MIGTLEEKTNEGIHKEQAITGEGADNALVVFLRQMLGSTLEQFDEDELESNLPF